MAPKPASGQTSQRQLTPALNAQKSGVLSLLHGGDTDDTDPLNSLNGIKMVITHRSEGIDHSGQLSFPGGKSGPHETAQETALREAHEEIGIPTHQVQILGKLSGLYIRHSNNFVHPVIGWIPELPSLNLNPDEVQEAFSVSISKLIGDKYRKREFWTLRDHGLHVPFWDIHDVPLWGATAMMVSELIQLCEEYIAA
jgi:8-oxo-dGTP pyrophosphatase MutT (NUDIX family)